MNGRRMSPLLIALLWAVSPAASEAQTIWIADDFDSYGNDHDFSGRNGWHAGWARTDLRYGSGGDTWFICGGRLHSTTDSHCGQQYGRADCMFGSDSYPGAPGGSGKEPEDNWIVKSNALTWAEPDFQMVFQFVNYDDDSVGLVFRMQDDRNYYLYLWSWNESLPQNERGELLWNRPCCEGGIAAPVCGTAAPQPSECSTPALAAYRPRFLSRAMAHGGFLYRVRNGVPVLLARSPVSYALGGHAYSVRVRGIGRRIQIWMDRDLNGLQDSDLVIDHSDTSPDAIVSGGEYGVMEYDNSEFYVDGYVLQEAPVPPEIATSRTSVTPDHRNGFVSVDAEASRAATWTLTLLAPSGQSCSAGAPVLAQHVSAPGLRSARHTFVSLHPGAGYCWKIRAENRFGGTEQLSPAPVTLLPFLTASNPEIQPSTRRSAAFAFSSNASADGRLEYDLAPARDAAYALQLGGGGAATYAQIQDRPSIRLGSNQTIEAWVLSEGTPASGWTRILGKGSADIRENYSLWLHHTGAALFWIGSGSTTCSAETPPGAVALNQWRHLAGRYNGARLEIFVDGVLAGGSSCSIAPAQTSSPFVVGYSGRGAPFVGLVAHVALHDSALPVSTIVSHAASGPRTELSAEASTVLQWDFREPPSVQAVFDSSPAKNHGFLGSSVGIDTADPSRHPSFLLSASGGVGTTAFSSAVSGLTPDTTYVARAFVRSTGDTREALSWLREFRGLQDPTAPSVVAAPLHVAECTSGGGADASLPAPAATDEVDPNPVVEAHLGSAIGPLIRFPWRFNLGESTVVWTARDEAGNVGTASVIVRVIDRTPPVVVAGGEIAVEATSALGTPVVPTIASASDSCTPVTIVHDGPSLYPVGATLVTFFVSDSSGNVTVASRAVRIVDTTGPGLGGSSVDTDGDGRSDAEEDANGNGIVDGAETNPLQSDTDGDGALDGAELLLGTDPRDAASRPSPDTDGDGLTDAKEAVLGTNPGARDTDGDGIPDGEEDANRNGIVDGTETSPLQSDTDGDGASDYVERLNGTNPKSAASVPGADADGDQLSNVREATLGTNANVADTDGDGVPDGLEVFLGSNPLATDTDGDTLSDGIERLLGTDLSSSDTDGDGIPDGEEDANRNGVVEATETDPRRADTDDDGYSDDFERARGTNPLDPASRPGGAPVRLRDLIVGHDGTACFAFEPPPPAAIDAGSGEATVQLAGAPRCWSLGVHEIVWTATDRLGNASTARQRVIVVPGTIAVTVVGLEVSGAAAQQGRYQRGDVEVVFDVSGSTGPLSVRLTPPAASLTSAGTRYRARYSEEGSFRVLIQVQDTAFNGGSGTAPHFGIDRRAPEIDADVAPFPAVDGTPWPLFFGEALRLDRIVARDGFVNLSNLSHALRFDGVNDVVVLPGTASTGIATAVTLQAWMRPSSLRDATLLFQANASGSGPGVSLSLMGGGKGRVELAVSGQRVEVSGGEVSPGSWNQLAATYDGRVVRLFVNGRPVGQRWASGPLEVGSTPLYLGGRIAGAGVLGAFEGELSEVAIWRVASTEADIADRYRGGLGRRAIASQDAAALYRFSEAGQVILDDSPSGADGTLGESAALGEDDPVRVRTEDPLDTGSSGVVDLEVRLERRDDLLGIAVVREQWAASGTPLAVGARRLGGSGCSPQAGPPCKPGEVELSAEDISAWALGAEGDVRLRIRARDAAGNESERVVDFRTRSYRGALDDAIDAIGSPIDGLLSDPLNTSAQVELEDALRAFEAAQRYWDMTCGPPVSVPCSYFDGSYLRADQGSALLWDAADVGVEIAGTPSFVIRAMTGAIHLLVESLRGAALHPDDAVLWRDAERYLENARIEALVGQYALAAALARTGLERVDLLYGAYQPARTKLREVRSRWLQGLANLDAGVWTREVLRLDATRLELSGELARETRDMLRVVYAEIDAVLRERATTERGELSEILDVIDKTSSVGDEAGDLIAISNLAVSDACLDLLAAPFNLDDSTFTRCYLRLSDMAIETQDVVDVLVSTSRWRSAMATALFNMLELSLFASPTGLPWVSSPVAYPPEVLILPDALAAQTSGATALSTVDVGGDLRQAYEQHDLAFDSLSLARVDAAFQAFLENRCLILRLYNRYYSTSRTVANVADPKEAPIDPTSVGCTP